jgi:hyperosmotically inducible protein
MKSDRELQIDILEERCWKPEVDATDIAATGKDGAVAVEGPVDTFAQKWAAKTAPKRLPGRLLLLFAVLAGTCVLWAEDQRQAPPQAVERIAKEVRHEILMLPYYDVFDNIKFSVTGYDVTLEGQVTNPTLKHDAENVVKHIEGVEKVNNQIEVLPLSSMDDGLRVRLYRAIYGYPALEKYAMPVIKPIRIIVKTGNVTLEGVVDNQTDKDLVALRANGVSGVFSVTNNLVVVKPK